MNDENGELRDGEAPGMTSAGRSRGPIQGGSSLALLDLQRQIDELKANYDSILKRLRIKIKVEDVIHTWKDEEGKPTCTLSEYLDLMDSSIDDEIDVTYKKVEINLEHIEALEDKYTVSDLLHGLTCKCEDKGSFAIRFVCLRCREEAWRGPVR